MYRFNHYSFYLYCLADTLNEVHKGHTSALREIVHKNMRSSDQLYPHHLHEENMEASKSDLNTQDKETKIREAERLFKLTSVIVILITFSGGAVLILIKLSQPYPKTCNPRRQVFVNLRRYLPEMDIKVDPNHFDQKE